MPEEPERITKPTKAKPIAATPVFDDTPAVRLEYPKLVKRPKVSPAPKAVASSIELKAAKGGFIKAKPPAKPKAVAKGKPKSR